MPRIIRGTKFDDSLQGTSADERLVGGLGNDYIFGEGGGHDDAYGGRGNDDITLTDGTGRVLGGIGNDELTGLRGFYTMAGGKGNDQLLGEGALYGDERPGLAQRTVGNDRLYTPMTSEERDSTQTGGRGADAFIVDANFNGLGASSSVTVKDFRPGEGDHALMALSYQTSEGIANGFLTPAQTWGVFDSNGNGVLAGDDVPWDGNSGVTIANGSLTLRLHEDTMTFEGVTQLNAADWLFQY